MANWDKRFIKLAKYISTWSKYPGRKVGAVIADDLHRVVSVGYNGLPRNCDDDKPERYEDNVKYKWAEHAERNAIYNAQTSVRGMTIYLPWFPCVDCARAIVQSGIKCVVCGEPDFDDLDWGLDFKIANEMFTEVGLEIRFIDNMKPVGVSTRQQRRGSK